MHRPRTRARDVVSWLNIVEEKQANPTGGELPDGTRSLNSGAEEAEMRNVLPYKVKGWPGHPHSSTRNSPSAADPMLLLPLPDA